LTKKLEFLHKLTRDGVNEDTLQQYVFHRVQQDRVVFNVLTPEKGEYALQLYAKEADSSGSFGNVCNYLLDCDAEPEENTPFPEVVNGRLGPTPQADDFKLNPATHPSSFVVAPPSGKVELTFQLNHPLEFVAKLELQTETGPVDVSDYVIWEATNESATIRVTIPERGKYHLILFGRLANSEGGYVPLYHYLIEANFNDVTGTSCPKQYGPWTTGCQVHEPLSGRLPANERVLFSVVVPGHDVAAIGSNGWTHLRKTPGGVWEGHVTTGDAGTQLKLAACMHQSSSSFTTLLLYRVRW
jgi:hypothetical protein